MKIAITSSGDTPDSLLETRFGRAPKFIIYDTESDTYYAIDNSQNLNAPQGAGLQSAQKVAREAVEAVITGHCGPKAFQVLKSAGIKVCYSQDRTVKEAIEAFKSGKLVEAGSPDVEGHWV
ncbi:NifB/NifX family molybdenum-iron cluster-binding protein [Thermodesulforhabdus norvegica]|uniref:Predicted Fe-Mo cluster-binding protein, NifX family n=1 Tax=Thermodesulforhabdus norvegica TaxID=39841 RepID=A0A1I4VSU9_9BACT|nr:NifB/NifX family molybdenum-iron cluster-binding protein [Thermodesulforhabdus norvegica]SFN04205.1 Predicted Fe-Mo cluster-binding protein, NifX family [Thermodesulforhabdus norvegica]